MRILQALTYYRPHLSGLTIYVERLAHALSARGHEVTVLASQHDAALPLVEDGAGVRVVRVPVAFRAGKGVAMPTHGAHAIRLLREHDVVGIHLPQLEAAGLALGARVLDCPSVITYHCDLQLPAGLLNRAADGLTAAVNTVAVASADRVVAYTQDYADHTPALRRARGKLTVVPPPVTMPEPRREDVEAFRTAHGLRMNGGHGPLVGFAARFAAEKGIHVLLAALPTLLPRVPGLKVLFAGPYEDVVGERPYRDRLSPAIAAFGEHWEFLGTLDPVSEMPAFLGALDCLLVPSVNSTESFGLVQVEAMLCGTPVVASALPGVREPVRITGMGELAPPGDPNGLAAAITRVLTQRERYVCPRRQVARRFDLERTAVAYESLFEELLAARRRPRRGP